jgi:two-component system, LytTR family, sensor kinase
LKSRTLLYHFLFWASIYALWVAVFRSYSVTISKTMTIEFCYLIFITADYYCINHFIVPQLLGKRKYVLFVSGILVVIGLSAWLRALVALYMSGHIFRISPIAGFGSLFLYSVLNISLWVLVVTLGKLLVDRMQTTQQLELLEKERIQNELDYLKAQINPHSLFNSLNTIYGHIDKQNPVARNILLQFSELLRYQLYECGAEKVCLERELGYIENYVAFQRLRKDGQLIVTFNRGAIGKGLEIAPLLLVVLIENAFKFVSNFSDKQNKISIGIHTRGRTLYSSFVNTREPQPAANGSHEKGIGLTNLNRRLELLYHKKYELTTIKEPELYKTNLTIDLS